MRPYKDWKAKLERVNSLKVQFGNIAVCVEKAGTSVVGGKFGDLLLRVF